MKEKNKKMISLMLGSALAISFTGCSKVATIPKEVLTEYESTTFLPKKDYSETTESMVEESTKEVTKETITTANKPIKQGDIDYAYVTANVNLRKEASKESEKITLIDCYQKVIIEGEKNNFYYASYGVLKGYIHKDYVKRLEDTFVEVDISDQDVYFYDKDICTLKADVVTGKKNVYDTRLGCNAIFKKQQKRYLIGDDYKLFVEYWMQFDGGIGLHDNHNRVSYKDTDYVNLGSHGCVNMKLNDARFLYEHTEVGTKVLVHK